MRYEKELFGEMQDYHVWTDTDPNEVNVGDLVTLVNQNCEFSFDNIKGSFEEDLLYCLVCDLELLEYDLTEYEVGKSNNGGAYAYAGAKILKIKEIAY